MTIIALFALNMRIAYAHSHCNIWSRHLFNRKLQVSCCKTCVFLWARPETPNRMSRTGLGLLPDSNRMSWTGFMVTALGTKYTTTHRLPLSPARWPSTLLRTPVIVLFGFFRPSLSYIKALVAGSLCGEWVPAPGKYPRASWFQGWN